jgi:hypothetical protein
MKTSGRVLAGTMLTVIAVSYGGLAAAGPHGGLTLHAMSHSVGMSGIAATGSSTSRGTRTNGIAGTGTSQNGIAGTGTTQNGIAGTGTQQNGIAGTGTSQNGIAGTGTKQNGIAGTGGPSQ